ncbi:MAG: hypothetical protein MZV64_29705 [Ignavibacteriales bacterium]|nr:hypothetical protein [Ignavibacteriales bacterium]
MVMTSPCSTLKKPSAINWVESAMFARTESPSTARCSRCHREALSIRWPMYVINIGGTTQIPVMVTVSPTYGET